jgi:hypothetical protein
MEVADRQEVGLSLGKQIRAAAPRQVGQCRLRREL